MTAIKTMDEVFARYRQLGGILDRFNVGCLILSRELRILELNRSAELITGLERATIVGKPCHKVFRGVLCNGKCGFRKMVESGGSAGRAADEIIDQSDMQHSITRVISPLYGNDRTLMGCVEIFQDHSAFKDLIERVRYDDRRLKIILDNLDIGIMTVDCSGHVTFFNAMAENISGFSRKDILGKSCATLFGKESFQDVLPLSETIADGKPQPSREGQIITGRGQTIPVQANYMALKNEDGRTVGGLVTISDLSLMYQFKSAISDRYTFYDMVGKDPVMQNIFQIIPLIAASNATVLIEGPTGTGKDVLAKVIHNTSPRREKALVKVNCAALPDNLLESEMFGYVKGAFTGADKDKPGRFQEADGGTIFLDEIGDLPLSLQAKLLRVLEDQDFYPLGSRKPTKVNVRIVAATNQGLERLVKSRRFREDLFFRLNVMRLDLPPLSERRGDIPLLISHILKRLCAARDTQVDKISEDAMEVLLNHDYPGNIRELENIIEHALIICRGVTIERKHLPLALRRNIGDLGRLQPNDALFENRTESSEKGAISNMLKKYGWNRSKTAKALGIDRSTLWRKMKRLNIKRAL